MSVVSTGIKEGDEIQSYTFQKSETGKEDFDEGTKIETKDTKCEYTYEAIEKDKTYYLRAVVTYESGEKKYSNIVKIGGASGGTGEEEKPVEDVYIGKYVNYVPKGTSYTATSELSGYSTSQTFNQDTDLKWRIWSIDDEKLCLISDKPPKSGVRKIDVKLEGANGYNNGVWILDNICNNNYENSEYNGLVARSLKISDIEKVTKYKFTECDILGTKYGEEFTTITRFGCYPTIWNEIDKNDNKIPYSKGSEQTKIYSGNGGKITGFNDKVEITFRQRAWEHIYTLEDASSEWVNPNYYQLLSPKVEDYNNDYYLSSRYSFNEFANDASMDSGINYGLYHIQSSDNQFSVSIGEPTYDGGDYTQERNGSVRPFIEIPASSYTLSNSNTEGIDFDIQPK